MRVDILQLWTLQKVHQFDVEGAAFPGATDGLWTNLEQQHI